MDTVPNSAGHPPCGAQSWRSVSACIDRELLFTRHRGCFVAGQGRHHRGHRGGVAGAAGHAGVPGDVPVPPAAAGGACPGRQAIHRRLSRARGVVKPDMNESCSSVGWRMPLQVEHDADRYHLAI